MSYEMFLAIAAITKRKVILPPDCWMLFLSESQEKDEEEEVPQNNEESQSNQGRMFKVSLSKMLTGLKSDPEAESKGAVEELKSFTQKRGINIDPINMFWIHRQKDQTTTPKCGILHKYVN